MPAFRTMKDTHPDTCRQYKRHSVPSHLMPPASPTGHLHWSITDMTITQDEGESSDSINTNSNNRNHRSASLPFLTLHDLQPYVQPPTINVVVLGSSSVGKTSLITQFVSSISTDMTDYESMLSGKANNTMHCVKQIVSHSAQSKNAVYVHFGGHTDYLLLP